MANPTTVQLKEKAIELGIVLEGNESYAQIKDMIAKIEAPTEGDENLAEVTPPTPTTTAPVEPTTTNDDDLEAGSEENAGKLKDAKNARSTGIKVGTETPEGKVYSQDEVFKILEEYKKRQGDTAQKTEEDVEEIDYSNVRVARYKDKFIVGLKKQQMDEFFATDEVYSIDVYDEKQRTMVPMVVALFEDGTELTCPLHKLVQVGSKYTVSCKVVEEKLLQDLTKTIGKVERMQYKDSSYSAEGTGVKVKQTVVQKKFSYIVEIPGGNGKTMEVQPEVINW